MKNRVFITAAFAFCSLVTHAEQQHHHHHHDHPNPEIIKGIKKHEKEKSETNRHFAKAAAWGIGSTVIYFLSSKHRKEFIKFMSTMYADPYLKAAKIDGITKGILFSAHGNGLIHWVQGAKHYFFPSHPHPLKHTHEN